MLQDNLLDDKPQTTIAASCTVEGVGVHTNASVVVEFRPGDVDTGIQIIRLDLPGSPRVRIEPKNVEAGPRGTRVRLNGDAVFTIEHLLAACAALSIDNLEVHLSANELPVLDGSGKELAETFLGVGLKEQETPRRVYRVTRPESVTDEAGSITALPAEEFRISYTLQYENPLIGCQYKDLSLSPKTIHDELLPARTFCLYEEVEHLRDQGLALGGSLDCAVVIDHDKILNEDGLRFEDEFVRHKILDLVGDLYVAGGPILGHFIAMRTGHRHNISLLNRLFESGALVPARNVIPMDVKGIRSILPHRYPFLLVDRIIELEIGRRAVGVKNVTGNEPFFLGHFPAEPVFPGVLIMEALAQVAGVCILSLPQHRGRIPYFTGMDQVKFRRPIIPGDQVRLEIIVDRLRSTMGRAIGRALVDGQLAAEGIIKFTVM